MRTIWILLLLFLPPAAHADFVGGVAHELASAMRGDETHSDDDGDDGDE